MSHWADNEIALLDECSINTVLSILIHKFQLSHGSLPEVVYLNQSCRMSFVTELMKYHALPADAAVLSPVWLHGFGKDIPLLYTSELGENYVQLVNKSLNAVMTL